MVASSLTLPDPFDRLHRGRAHIGAGIVVRQLLELCEGSLVTHLPQARRSRLSDFFVLIQKRRHQRIQRPRVTESAKRPDCSLFRRYRGGSKHRKNRSDRRRVTYLSERFYGFRSGAGLIGAHQINERADRLFGTYVLDRACIAPPRR